MKKSIKNIRVCFHDIVTIQCTRIWRAASSTSWYFFSRKFILTVDIVLVAAPQISVCPLCMHSMHREKFVWTKQFLTGFRWTNLNINFELKQFKFFKLFPCISCETLNCSFPFHFSSSLFKVRNINNISLLSFNKRLSFRCLVRPRTFSWWCHVSRCTKSVL